jgi:DNA repair exonuclease SbcCD ATPase subunit
VPNLNKAISHNLNLFNLPFMLEFDDGMNFRFESRFGLAPSYNALSQGQKRKLNFAIAVAFRDFVTSIADFRINILFLDEVLDISTDEEALEHMIQLLKAKVHEIGGIYLMSHRGEQFTEYFDRCISVQNDGRYSSLEMKELPKSSNY